MATKRLTLDDAMIDEVLAGQIDIMRFEAGVRLQMLKLLEQLRQELAGKLVAGNLTEFGKARTMQMIRQATDIIDKYYASMQSSLDASLAAVGQVAARHSSSIIMAAGLPTKAFFDKLVTNTLIFGAQSKDWWARQKKDLVFRFSSAVRQGLVGGETNEAIVRKIVGTATMPGIMAAPRAQVRGLVHASIQAVANAARMETYKKNADVISALRQLSTLDGHTTDICIAYSDKMWDLKTLKPIGHQLPFKGGTPRHWGCRSVIVPVTKSFMKSPRRGQRAASGGPVPASTTFEQWLSRRTEEQQNEQLGKGRAELWRKGKLTLTQLLSLDGNPLSLKQLERRYA